MSRYIPYSRIVSKIGPSSLSEKIIEKIRLVSARKSHLASPFGSWILRYQKYPGDVDLHEDFKDCCSKKDVIRKFTKKIKIIVRDLGNQKLNYITEFKMGLDNRYDVSPGVLDQGIYYINDDLGSYIKDNYKLLSSDEKKVLKEIIAKEYHTTEDYDMVNLIFREHRILRWRDNELRNGYKVLPYGGGQISIEEALSYKTHVKIDTVTLINDRFSEVTNFWYLSYIKEDGTEIPINTDFLFTPSEEMQNIYLNQLKDEVEKLRFSKMYFNPFKMCKRMWALARAIEDKNTIEKLSTFITGHISELYQMKSEIEAIISILKFTGFDPIQTINSQLDKIKFNISKIIQLSQDELSIFDNTIKKYIKYSEIDTSKARKKKLNILTDIKYFLSKIINNETVYQLQINKIYIPPRHLLPNKLKYVSDDQYNSAINAYGGELDSYYSQEEQKNKFKDKRDFYIRHYFSMIFNDYAPKYHTLQSKINAAISDIEKS